MLLKYFHIYFRVRNTVTYNNQNVKKCDIFQKFFLRISRLIMIAANYTRGLQGHVRYEKDLFAKIRQDKDSAEERVNRRKKNRFLREDARGFQEVWQWNGQHARGGA